MDGIVNLLKPTGMTSHDVVSSIRRVFSIKKVGHTGTLDPNAAGVLPICLGKATKLSQYLMDKEKAYRCQMIFGKTTDTLDSYGRICEDPDPSQEEIPQERILQILSAFTGEISQLPPSFSAIKIGGERLYRKARRGEAVKEIPMRTIFIHQLSLIDYRYPSVSFDVSCSKGTYIRSLVRDIAQALGRQAYMSLLIRTGSGQFRIEQAVTLERLFAEGIERHLIRAEQIQFPMDDLLIKASSQTSYINGTPVSSKGVQMPLTEPQRLVRVFGEELGFIGIGRILVKEGELCLKSETLLI